MRLSSMTSLSLGERVSASIHCGGLTATTLRLPRNSNVYCCGDRGHCIYLVEEGQVKILTHSACGKDCLVAIYTAGDIFGEQSLLHEDRSETATAMTPVVLKRISRESFTGFLAEDGLLEDFVRYSVARLSERQCVITDLVTADSEQRLAATLLRLARKLGRGAPSRLRIEERISQEDLSRIVGTTRSRVGHFLKKFRQMGLIESREDCFLAIDEQRLSDYVQRGL